MPGVRSATKVPKTIALERELLDRVERAVELAGDRSMTALLVRALEVEVVRVEQEHAASVAAAAIREEQEREHFGGLPLDE